MPDTATSTTVHGVRWTNNLGDTTVRQLDDEYTAIRLVIALREIQHRRGAIPDAHLVAREQRDGHPVGEWTAVERTRGR